MPYLYNASLQYGLMQDWRGCSNTPAPSYIRYNNTVTRGATVDYITKTKWKRQVEWTTQTSGSGAFMRGAFSPADLSDPQHREARCQSRYRTTPISYLSETNVKVRMAGSPVIIKEEWRCGVETRSAKLCRNSRQVRCNADQLTHTMFTLFFLFTLAPRLKYDVHFAILDYISSVT